MVFASIRLHIVPGPFFLQELCKYLPTPGLGMIIKKIIGVLPAKNLSFIFFFLV